MLHICSCIRCAPTYYPPEALSPERTSERHVGVRLLSARETMYTHVTIDGVEHRRVYECMAGRDGWALVYQDSLTHDCWGCFSGLPCLLVMRGHVKLVLTEPSAT
jgi:hypothetical protein